MGNAGPDMSDMCLGAPNNIHPTQIPDTKLETLVYML
jgi:hypothetical protein